MTSEIKNHLTANMNTARKNIMIGNFLGGLAWGLGTVIGASVIMGIIGYILKFLGFFNTVSTFFNQFTP